MKISNYFTIAEATKTDTGLNNTPNDTQARNIVLTASRMDLIRTILGKPVIVNSWFRSEIVNKKVGGAHNSQHKLGQAVDIKVKGMTPREIVDKIKSSGVSYDQLILYPTFVHISFKTNIEENRKQFIVK